MCIVHYINSPCSLRFLSYQHLYNRNFFPHPSELLAMANFVLFVTEKFISPLPISLFSRVQGRCSQLLWPCPLSSFSDSFTSTMALNRFFKKRPNEAETVLAFTSTHLQQMIHSTTSPSSSYKKNNQHYNPDLVYKYKICKLQLHLKNHIFSSEPWIHMVIIILNRMENWVLDPCMLT